MDQRRQGWMCLCLGLICLGGFLLLDRQWLDPKAAAKDGRFVCSERVLQRLPGRSGSNVRRRPKDVWQRVYRGDYRTHTPEGSQRFSWTVTLYGLPLEEDGTQPILVHSVESPCLIWSGGRASDRAAQRVSVVWIDRSGAPVRWNVPPKTDLTLRPIHSLVLRLPQETTSSMRGALLGAGHMRWEFAPHPHRPACEDSLRFVVRSGALADQLLDVRRRLCLQGDRATGLITEMTSQVIHTDVRCDGILRLERTAQLTAERSADLVMDFQAWMEQDAETWQLIDRTASGEIASAAILDQQFSGYCDRFMQVRDGCRDPITRMGVEQALVRSGIVQQRLVVSLEESDRLRNTGLPEWRFEEMSGRVHQRDDYIGRVVVMGIVRGVSEPVVGALEALVQMRRRWAPEQVAVLAISSDHQLQRAVMLEQAVGNVVTVAREVPDVVPFSPLSVGLPTILVIDPQGRLHTAHAWQCGSRVESLVECIDRLVASEMAPSSGAPNVGGIMADRLTRAAP